MTRRTEDLPGRRSRRGPTSPEPTLPDGRSAECSLGSLAMGESPVPCESARDDRRGAARLARHRRRTGRRRGAGGARGAARLGGDPGVGHRCRDGHGLGRRGRCDGLHCRRPGRQYTIPGKQRGHAAFPTARWSSVGSSPSPGSSSSPSWASSLGSSSASTRPSSSGSATNGLAIDEGRPACRWCLDARRALVRSAGHGGVDHRGDRYLTTVFAMAPDRLVASDWRSPIESG